MGAWVAWTAVCAGRPLAAGGEAAAGLVAAAGGAVARAAGERCTSPRTPRRDGVRPGAAGRGDTGSTVAAPGAGAGFARAAGRRAVPSPMAWDSGGPGAAAVGLAVTMGGCPA